ncbi:hypothetical protein V1517DRAFT_210360 [Lipomyces orientalis]|uniref:Uncharacterized protein n=1 Tax=Lipomyces orientalis TaxID=1233043 RepID=A0ACC3THN5_9ASCO
MDTKYDLNMEFLNSASTILSSIPAIIKQHLFPQFLGKLQAKLEIDTAAIGTGRDHVWYGFSRLDGKAAARVYPWISTYKDSAAD